MSTKAAHIPAETPLPWERNEGDIFIEEPMKQLLMVRGWGWMSKEYGEKRAEEIQDKILDFTLTAVNHHQELLTRLYNLKNAVYCLKGVGEPGVSYTVNDAWAKIDLAIIDADETLKKLIQ